MKEYAENSRNADEPEGLAPSRTRSQAQPMIGIAAPNTSEPRSSASASPCARARYQPRIHRLVAVPFHDEGHQAEIESAERRREEEAPMSPFASAIARAGMSAATRANASMICCTASSAPKAELVKPGSSETIQTTPATLTATPWKTSASAAPRRPMHSAASKTPIIGISDERDEPAHGEGRRIEEKARDVRRRRRPLAPTDRGDGETAAGSRRRSAEKAQRHIQAARIGVAAGPQRPPVVTWIRASVTAPSGAELQKTNPTSPPAATSRGESAALAAMQDRRRKRREQKRSSAQELFLTGGERSSRVLLERRGLLQFSEPSRSASSGFAEARGYRRQSPSDHAGERARRRNT